MRRATHKLELENWELGREAMEFKQPKKGLSFKGKKIRHLGVATARSQEAAQWQSHSPINEGGGDVICI
jgi:hypothetical protein